MLDKYANSNADYYKHNDDDEPYDCVGEFKVFSLWPELPETENAC